MEESGTPTEYASISESGNIVLSPEAIDAMENTLSFADEVSPPAETEAPPVEDTPTPKATRTIKHNGQDVNIEADQEIALLQKGYNYETKMAQLEAERAKLQSYNGLVSAIEASPEIRAKVSQALGYEAQPPAQPATPQFDDPIEQLKWEVRQETLREVEDKFMKPMQQQTAMTAHQNHINGLRQQVQADPQYKEVQAAILEQIMALPESVGKDLYQRLDQDPRAYTEMFNSVKARLTIKPTNQSPAADTPQPLKRETKSPILESGNNAPETSAVQQKQTALIKELERKSRNGDFKATGELMAMLA